MTGVSTIAAIATGPSAGGIGVIRISGPDALKAARRVVRGLPDVVSPRHAYVARFVDEQERVLDEGLVLYFEAPRSFTGEEVVELQGHGAPRVLSMLLEVILRSGNVRLASAGEFTRRAYLSGRIELTRAEAVADLIAAESEAQVRAAAAQLSGEFGARLDALKAPLLALQAEVEGSLDFPEEADDAEVDVGARLAEIETNARSLFADSKRGALLRRGARVVLYGPVNAGKSTLFNALLGANRALVDAEPGTTRDSLEGKLELGGLTVTLVDTAGLRADPGRVEALGIERTRSAIEGADVVLALGDVPSGVGAAVIQVSSKSDLSGARVDGLRVSALTGEGLETLREAIFAALGGAMAGAVVSSSERHALGLSEVVAAIERARIAAGVSTLEVVAGEIGTALEAMSELLGTDARTELLDAIFARFCIGK